MDLNYWCVKVTKENKAILQSYMNLGGFSWSDGAYYGKKDNMFWGHQRSWGTILTFEEFQEKFIKGDKDPHYEIY